MTQGIIDKVNTAEATHLLPARYDAVLGVLFPAMAPVLTRATAQSTSPVTYMTDAGKHFIR